MSNRTKGNWKILWAGANVVAIVTDLDIQESVICDEPQPSVPQSIWRANAEFICRAVNHHDALVEALEKLINANDESCEGIAQWSSIWDEANEVLEKVKGK